MNNVVPKNSLSEPIAAVLFAIIIVLILSYIMPTDINNKNECQQIK